MIAIPDVVQICHAAAHKAMAVSAVVTCCNVYKVMTMPAVIPFCRAVAFKLMLYPQ